MIRNRVTVTQFCLLVLGSTQWACQQRPGVHDPVREARVQERASRMFYRADYFKPNPAGLDDDITLMAPLILQEVRDDEPSSMWFGGVVDAGATSAEASTSARPQVDPNVPVVYYGTSTTRIGGKAHEQISYIWFYPESDGLACQGLRMTLGGDGRALSWEVLADPEPVEIVYVSTQLERAAIAAFGTAVEGRAHAVQQTVRTTPAVVVPRVLEDGPAPMGPWVYVQAPDHAVSTVLCRCMPSQVGEFAAETYYQLLPIEELRACGLDLSQLQQQLRPAGSWLTFPLNCASCDNAGRKLRWPPG